MKISALILALFLASGWPAGPLDKADIQAVGEGKVVGKRWIKEGALHGKFGAQIRADSAWVVQKFRATCFTLKQEGMIDLRFYPPDQIQQAFAEGFTKTERKDVEALPHATCNDVKALNTFYGFVVFDSPGFFPDLWSLTRYVVKTDETGATHLKTEKVAGSNGPASSETAFLPLSENVTVVTAGLSFDLGIPAPDSVIRFIVPTKDEAPRAKQLRALQTQAQKEDPAPKKPPVEATP
jgi:hypothetical protein